jgi:hypothetical protein
MNARFRITVGSEPNYDDLVGNIYFDDCIVCIVTQEEGFDLMEVELFAPPEGSTWRFGLKDFEEALAALKNRMWELRRVDSGDPSKIE